MKCAALISCLAFVTLEDILACRSQRGTGVTNNINYGSVPLKPFPSTCIDVHLLSICPWKKKKKERKLSGSAGNLTKCKYYKKGWGGKCDVWIIKARHLSGTCEYLHAQTMQASKQAKRYKSRMLKWCSCQETTCLLNGLVCGRAAMQAVRPP